MSAYRRLLVNLGVAGLSTAVALALGELAVRAFAPQQLILVRPDIWMPADTVGWLARPYTHTLVNTGERTVHVYTDGEGFRVGAAGPVAARREVLVLGDSFMEALQVEYEQSVAGLLEQRLPLALHEPIAVRNAGVDGWDPPQYYLRARTLLARRHYDLLIVSLFLGNDVVDRWPTYFPPRGPVTRHALRLPRHLNRAELVNAVLYPIDDFLKVHSELFVFLKTRFATLFMRARLSADEFPEEFYRREATAPRWNLTGDICAAIAAVGREHKTPVLFVMIPTAFQVDQRAFLTYVRGLAIDSTAVDLDQPDRLMGAALRERGLSMIDALPTLRKAHDRGGDEYGHVDHHLSPAGHAVVESLVEPYAARCVTNGRSCP